MLTVKFTSKFKKDYKASIKRGYDITQLEYVINELMNQRKIDEKYKDHALSGDYSGFRECHIQPDWLLIYKIDNSQLILTAFRTGTHSDLFE